VDKDKALRLALEAMEKNWFPLTGHTAAIKDKAITACKQALANDALDRMADNERELGIQMQPEPPCKTGSQCTSKCEGCAETPVEIGVDVSSEGAYVVGMYVLPDAVRYVFYSQFHPNTSPPQRKPLTDEQKLALCKQFPDHLTFNAIKAIEAAHGIKE
jgi:hypothetical protein